MDCHQGGNPGAVVPNLHANFADSRRHDWMDDTNPNDCDETIDSSRRTGMADRVTSTLQGSLGKAALLGCLVFLGGCAISRERLNRALLADRQPGAHTHDLPAHYRVRCSDVLAVQVSNRKEFSGLHTVGLDGRIRLANREVEVDGKSTSRIAAAVAREIGTSPEQVQVSVEEHKSQHLYVFGEIDPKHQVVPYHGPETILDFLQRIGGMPEGASFADVRVVRGHVADGHNPEVFHVDLYAIVVKKDLTTNIRLEPSDHIHLGQSQRTRVTCKLPPWLQRLCGKDRNPPEKSGQSDKSDKSGQSDKSRKSDKPNQTAQPLYNPAKGKKAE